MMYLTLCIKRALSLVLAGLLFLAWVMYLHSPSDHTKPVLSLTPVDYLTHSLKSLQMEQDQNNETSVQNGENTEHSVLSVTPVLSLTSVGYLTHSSKSLQIEEHQNNRTLLQNYGIREDSVLSLAPFDKLTNSLKSLHMGEEQNNESPFLNGENREPVLSMAPVLYLTPADYLTQSLKSLQVHEEQNNGSSLQNRDSREDYTSLNDSLKMYDPLENEIETAKLLNVNENENITSNLIFNSTFKSASLSSFLQDSNSTSSPYTYSITTNEYDKLMFVSMWMQVLERRQQRVVEVCRRYKKQLKRIWGFGNLLYDTKHHLAYCRTAKAGTTWWLGSLLQWSGVSTVGLTPDIIHQVANQVFPPLNAQETKAQLDTDPFIFMAVRHPFTRLVSAYHDKIFNGYRKDLYSQMINTYTKDSKSEVLESLDSRRDVPTFREFVLFAAQQVNHCALVPNSACMLQVDVHWRPAHDRCAPCNVHYDAIIKLETFDSDERYIKLITGMPSNKNIGNGSVQNSQSVKTGLTTEDLTKQYFRSLTPEEVQTVIKAYYYDFLLFEYDPHQYSK